jgi:hypothetical protein
MVFVGTVAFLLRSTGDNPMAGMIDSYEVDVLDHITAGAGTASSPTSWYAALYTAAPAEDGTGGTEVSASEYERVIISNWAAASAGQPSTVSNSTSAITFAAATSSWGTVTHFGLCPAGTKAVADVKIWGTLDTSKAVDNGDTVSFAIGALTIQLGDPGDTY